MAHVATPAAGLVRPAGLGARPPGAGGRRGLPAVARRRRACLACASAGGEAVSLAALDVGGLLYTAGTQANDAVAGALSQGGSPASLLIIGAAGLLTSLSPCTLSVLPLTIGYIGGYQDAGDDGRSAAAAAPLGVRALAFSLGLASTLAALGVAASLAGKAYGQLGFGLPLSLSVSLLAMLMGLNLLNVVALPLPSIDLDVRRLELPATAQAYLAGAVFALAASPCSTPVLATLLAYVSTTGDPLQGGLLLLAYTTGYVTPLLLAATATDALSQLLATRQYSAWVTPISGGLLLTGGTYTLLSRLSDLQ